ncbi:MAG: DUF952 domain-containing protein [Actinomycetota bacterium]
MIFHITTADAWAEAERVGEYRTGTLETEGFIHCSEAHQVAEVANVRFRGREDLVLLWIDPERVRAEIKYEAALDARDTFPHIYGPLNVDAVVDATPYREEDGTFKRPS